MCFQSQQVTTWLAIEQSGCEHGPAFCCPDLLFCPCFKSACVERVVLVLVAFKIINISFGKAEGFFPCARFDNTMEQLFEPF